MVSRKKAKGKARKAKAKERQAAAAKEVDAIESQMQRLQIEDLLRGGAAAEDEECRHGLVQVSKDDISSEFMKTFLEAYNGGGDVDQFTAAIDATDIEEYSDVWIDTSKLESIRFYFLAYGTEQILNGNPTSARIMAALGCYFEDYTAVNLTKTKAVIDFRKVFELHDEDCDEHTVVSFLRKRVPCSCLDKKYEEVKSITKLGTCYHVQCPLPGRKEVRKTMMNCGRCLRVSYCSRECQKADWPKHKAQCETLALASNLKHWRRKRLYL
jgi:hypothetical protein